jgi:hypothetical protein
VAHQVADVLDAYAVDVEDGHERVPQLAWCPLVPQARGPGDDGELAADLPPIQRCAVLAAEDQVVVLPFRTRLEPFGGLTLAMLPERFHCLLGSLRRRRLLRVLVSPLARTDR